jgi:hypothetical protein
MCPTCTLEMFSIMRKLESDILEIGWISQLDFLAQLRRMLTTSVTSAQNL